MPFHKLADGPITMTIAAVKSAEGKFGPQMVFSSTEGVDVFISEMSERTSAGSELTRRLKKR